MTDERDVTAMNEDSYMENKTPIPKYTPEPWFVVEFAGYHHIQDGKFYEDSNLLDEDKCLRAPQNAARIVECVNALAGIDNPKEWVEKSKLVGNVVIRQQSEIEQLKKSLNNLSFMAQTSGGTAGKDDGLMKAIEKASELLK